MMYLTQEIARQNIGMMIDCYKRHFHYYPLEIVSRGDGLFVKDNTGTLSPVPDDKDSFNSIGFDYLFPKDAMRIMEAK